MFLLIRSYQVALSDFLALANFAEGAKTNINISRNNRPRGGLEINKRPSFYRSNN